MPVDASRRSASRGGEQLPAISVVDSARPGVGALVPVVEVGLDAFFVEAGLVPQRQGLDELLVELLAGGFVEVLNNTVTVLAETAELASEIDVERAKAAEAAALQRLSESGDPEERAKAAAKLERARNRLRASIASV